MKKRIFLILSIVFIFSAFTACSGTTTKFTGKIPFEKNGKDGYVLMHFKDTNRHQIQQVNQFTGVARYYHGIPTADGAGGDYARQRL